VVLYESRDGSQNRPPLSSFRICHKDIDKELSSAAPVWELDLRHAVQEAKKNLSFNLKLKPAARRSSLQRRGDSPRGRDRVERRRLESRLW
jgi:hypothetical protein